MKNIHNFLSSLIFVGAACILGVYIGINSKENDALSPQSIPKFSEFSQNSNSLYTIKEFNGKIAVFYQNNEFPEIVFDVYIGQLPEFDRNQLKTGINVDSYENLVVLIEDLTT